MLHGTFFLRRWSQLLASAAPELTFKNRKQVIVSEAVACLFGLVLNPEPEVLPWVFSPVDRRMEVCLCAISANDS